jgi:hypothetical protein
MAIIFGKVMRKTRLWKFAIGPPRIYRPILKTAKSNFVPGFSILLEATVDLEMFQSLPSWQILRLDWKRHELQYPVGCKRCAELHKSYRTVSSGAPANSGILHSKISHKTNKQWKFSYKNPRCSLDLGVSLVLLLKDPPVRAVGSFIRIPRTLWKIQHSAWSLAQIVASR